MRVGGLGKFPIPIASFESGTISHVNVG